MTEQHQTIEPPYVVDAEQVMQPGEYTSKLAEYLYRLADMSYRIEEERGRTLADLSAQLLTCVTILSVAFLTPASFLFECYRVDDGGLSVEQIRLIWMYAIVLVPLVVALLLVLWSRVLKPMEALSSPSKQADYVRDLLEHKEENSTMSDLDIAQSFCLGIEDKYNGMHDKHDKMWMLLRIAMHHVGASCVAALLFGLFLLFEISLSS